MKARVLVAPDKFKGTLSAAEAARAMSRGWKKARPTDHCVRFPVSDGGDGFGEILGRALKARPRTVLTVDAAGNPTRARWWWESETRTALVESANVIGLAHLPPGAYHPFQLDTFGLGKVFESVTRAGARHCLVGIGGSATNDGGFGLAKALGWRFLHHDDSEVLAWTELPDLKKVLPPTRQPPFKITVAVDVQNPLLGARGATRIYGPQKGLQADDLAPAEACLRRMTQVLSQAGLGGEGKEPGCGAAGGLGYGLLTFMKGQLVPGFDLLARHTGFDDLLGQADVVLTAEGSIDRSSLMGKGTGELLKRCEARGIPCVGLAGVLGDREAAQKRFCWVGALTPDITSRQEALDHPAFHLELLAERAAEAWNPVQMPTR